MKKVKIERTVQPRPAMRKQQRNARIREKLTDHVEVQVIPALSERDGYEKRKQRVCAYCRVSTDMDTQALSYELQVQNYTEYITSNSEWEFAGIYADRGISGTSLKHRDEFNRMIADCRAGKIDLIITKAVTRFARNVLDCISTIRMLKQLDPPVGVFFETERINTLDTTSETYLGLISLFAQGESESKSESLKWSYIRRWKRGTGIYPTWSLIGYDVDEDGKWVIVEEEAELVKIIYDMYLTGHSSPQIAEILTRSGIPTSTNKQVWSSGAVLGILRNEKYCGDVLYQKTISMDIFTHKAVKNTGQKPQYFIEGHHEAIIDKDDWLKVQQLIRDRFYIKQRKRRSKPKIVLNGCLAGFTQIDLNWDEDDVDYIFSAATPTATAVTEPAMAEHIQIIDIKGDYRIAKSKYCSLKWQKGVIFVKLLCFCQKKCIVRSF